MLDDASLWATVVIVGVLVTLSSFFSGSETALTAASRAKLKALADKKVRGAQTALKITDDNERMIGAILIGNNIVNILSTSLATAVLTHTFGDSGILLATLGMTVLVLIFGEIMPKTLAITHPESVSTHVAPIINLLIKVLTPFIFVVRWIVRIILTIFGFKADSVQNIHAIRDEIAGVISLGHSEGNFEKEDRDRLLGALDLGHRTVDEIMKHRRQIEMLNADLPPDDIITHVLASPHTRLPLYRENEENILGVIHAKDLLREVNRLRQVESGSSVSNLDITKIAMQPYFIPETTALDEQMREFLKRHTHFALVVDEYGALQGLITLEDILEEIVGDITDEFDVDKQHPPLKRLESGEYIVEGQMTIRDLNRAMDWGLPDDEANTIAGLIIHEAQTIPNEGQTFVFHGFRFEVLQKRENRITRLKILPLTRQ